MKLKNIKKYQTGGSGNNLRLGIPVPKTPVGRIYRFSPNATAFPQHFVMGDANRPASIDIAARGRMKLDPGSNQTVCPYSGFVDNDDAFMHPEDVKAAKEIVTEAAVADIQDELSRLFGGINRNQSKNSLISFNVKVDKRRRPKPRFSRRDLMRELECDHCGRDYGVYAIGLFCPDCGAPNLRLHFAREVELVSAQIKLAEDLDAQQELAYRLLGNAHEDVLTAFEATLKTVYMYGIGQRPAGSAAIKPVKNDFQNVDKGKERFADLGFDPYDSLSSDELDLLRLNIQKRHVIGHNLGIMDDKFVLLAGSAKVGETVHLVGADIQSFAEISQKVVDKLDAWLGGEPSPFIGASFPALGMPMHQIGARKTDDEKSLEQLDLDLSQLARQVGLWIARTCLDGMPSFIESETLLGAFPDNSEAELEVAIAELETDGFVETRRLMAGGIPYFRATLDLYLTFDPIAIMSNPIEDAVALTGRVLAGDDSVNVYELHTASVWDKRRFNPALAYVISHIDNRNISRTITAEYPTTSLFLSATDRVALQRFCQQFG